MSYTIKEIYRTLQGEGHHSGRACILIRTVGCNLWSGREEDRATAICPFCDTDFVGGDRLSAPAIAARAAELWGPNRHRRWAVLTGGEPTLQADAVLIEALNRFGFATQIETNGTRPLPPGLDWITVSPKAGAPLVLTAADEVKVVWPQALDLEALARFPAAHRYLQPMDGPEREANVKATAEYCLEHPEWKLSLQIHKAIGLP